MQMSEASQDITWCGVVLDGWHLALSVCPVFATWKLGTVRTSKRFKKWNWPFADFIPWCPGTSDMQLLVAIWEHPFEDD